MREGGDESRRGGNKGFNGGIKWTRSKQIKLEKMEKAECPCVSVRLPGASMSPGDLSSTYQRRCFPLL